jgi:hypothetical protein
MSRADLAPALRQRGVMRAIRIVLVLVLVLVLGACSDGAFGTCPTQSQEWPLDCTDIVEPGTSCDRPLDSDTALPESCYCESSGFWVCNSCPFYWTPAAPPGACTPGTTCVINSWEHGCDCGCADDGTWRCVAQTINSRCP